MEVFILKSKAEGLHWEIRGVFTTSVKAREHKKKYSNGNPLVRWAIENWNVDGNFEWIQFID